MITNRVLTDYIRDNYRRRKLSNLFKIFGARRLSAYAKYIVAENKKLSNSVHKGIDYSDIFRNPLSHCSTFCISGMYIDADMTATYKYSFDANYYNMKAGTSLSEIIDKRGYRI